MQVGRSGRFGHLGLAVNLITYEDRFNLYGTFPFGSKCLEFLWRTHTSFLSLLSSGIGLSKNLGLK